MIPTFNSVKEQIDYKFSARDPVYFYNTVLGYDAPWFVKEWFDYALKKRLLLVQSSRGHGKSTFARGYILWHCLFTPKTEVLIYSHNKLLAKDILKEIKKEFAKPVVEKFQPTDRDVWTKEYIQLVNESEISISSVGAASRGKHPNIVCADDVLSETSTISFGAIEDWFTGTVANLPVPEKPPGQILIIGTPFTHTDLYSKLQQNPEYTCLKYPAIAEDNDTLKHYPPGNDGILWPERRGRAYLDAKREELQDDLKFAREYLLRPLDIGSAVYPYNIVEKAQQLGKDRALWVTGAPPEGRYYVGVDLAISQSKDADYTVILVGQLRGDEKIEIVYIARDHFTKSETESEIRKVVNLFKPAVVNIESNQFQASLIEELRLKGLPVNGIQLHAQNKHDMCMFTRLQFQNERIVIPSSTYMGDYEKEKTRILTDELTNIAFKRTRAGNIQIEGILRHDDTHSALILMIDAVRHNNVDDLQIVGEIKDTNVGIKNWWSHNLNLRTRFGWT